ncbi:MAG: hypothetical protein JNK37_11675 [Verrucomicrobiales bacterium]|nr:hypothetical protein [Verrucomicrobiales bacterium]
MEVLLLTTLFSVAFAVLFLALFLRDRQVRRFGSVERDALMPLDDGDPLPSRQAKAESRGCGCGGHRKQPGKKEKICCQGCPCQN